MRIALLVNDSYFAYLIAQPIVAEFGDRIGLAIFSTRTTGSSRRIWAICRKTHAGYFVYRCLVQVVSRIAGWSGQTVRALLLRHGIAVINTPNIDDPALLAHLSGVDIAVALNFDQIIRPKLLNILPKGVLNAHASRLPYDKGISPALWAFSRGDCRVWTTIYRMGPQLDCGMIIAQYDMPVNQSDTAFTLYSRICKQAGIELTKILLDIERGAGDPIGESRETDGNYNGWPDARHREMLRASGRKLWRPRDLIGVVTGR